MKIHIVQKGDTLWKIAKKYGVDFTELKKLNSHLSNPDLIYPGMKIKVPGETVSVKNEGVTGGVKESPTKVLKSLISGAPKEQPYTQQPVVIEEVEETNIYNVNLGTPSKPMKEQPKPFVKEQPKPIVKEQPKPIVKEQPKPIVKEQPKPIIKEQPKVIPVPIPVPQKPVVQPMAPKVELKPPVAPKPEPATCDGMPVCDMESLMQAGWQPAPCYIAPYCQGYVPCHAHVPYPMHPMQQGQPCFPTPMMPQQMPTPDMMQCPPCPPVMPPQNMGQQPMPIPEQAQPQYPGVSNPWYPQMGMPQMNPQYMSGYPVNGMMPNVQPRFDNGWNPFPPVPNYQDPNLESNE